ncbi:MAG: hypothetical protein AB7F43_13235 [Bacteriovoracia bacterium]
MHRITSINFKTIQPNGIYRGTLLSAVGKIVVFFKCIKQNDSSFLFLVPGGFESAEAEFEKLHFMEKLEIRPRPDLSYIRILGPDLKSINSKSIVVSENRWNKNVWNEKESFSNDTSVVCLKDDLEQWKTYLTQNSFVEKKDLEEQRVLSGDPESIFELGRKTIPLEASLTDAIHENKGCYPGQEVIERIISMGKPPRLLCAVSGKGLKAGEKLFLQEKQVGDVTSVVEHNGTTYGLAIVSRQAVSSPNFETNKTDFSVNTTKVEIKLL